MTAREAAQQLGVSRHLIELWANPEGKGCPHLEGNRSLAKLTNPHSRKGVRYLTAEIEAVKAAREALLLVANGGETD